MSLEQNIQESVLRDGDSQRLLENKYWHLGLWGPAGSGKTRFIGTAGNIPSSKKVLLVDAEEGSVTIDTGKYPNVDILRVVDYQERLFGSSPSRSLNLWACVLEIVTWIESFVTTLEGVAEFSEEFPYWLVAIDGGTTIQAWCDAVVVSEVKRDNAELSSLPEFRIIASRLSALFWRVKRLPCHTVFTARQRLDETQHSTKDAKQYRASAGFYPKAGDEFNGMWDVLAFMDREPVGLDQKYIFSTRLSSKVLAKSRAGDLLPPTVEDPTAGKIFSYLKGESSS